MELIIGSKILEKFEGLSIGIVIANDIQNTGASNEILDEIKEQEKQVRLKYTAEALIQEPKIDAWRKTYSAFGAKPKEHRSSVENLYRLVLKDVNLRHINKIVDIYNLISLKHMLPLGGEDMDKIRGNIMLTFAEPNEPKVLLLGDNEERPPHPGEVIYKDDVSAICRRWNWREADRTKLTQETRNCILVIEGIPPVSKKEIEDATNELKDLIEKYCGGNITCALIDKEKPSIKIR